MIIKCDTECFQVPTPTHHDCGVVTTQCSVSSIYFQRRMSQRLGRVVIYSIAGCPHCLAAKTRLKAESLNFTEVRENQKEGETVSGTASFLVPAQSKMVMECKHQFFCLL